MQIQSPTTKLKLFNYSEAAELLGISQNTLRQYVSRKRIPFTKIGRNVRFTQDQIQEIIDAGREEALVRGRS